MIRKPVRNRRGHCALVPRAGRSFAGFAARRHVTVYRAIAVVVPERFRDLSPDGRRLIQRWAQDAGTALPPPATAQPAGPTSQHRRANSFEAFIYAWISFNGWASCCVEDERDSILVWVLGTERSLSDTFGDLVRSDLQGARALQRFHALWPIFRTTDIRGGHLPGEPRATRVRRYADSFPRAVRDCRLRCWCARSDCAPPRTGATARLHQSSRSRVARPTRRHRSLMPLIGVAGIPFARSRRAHARSGLLTEVAARPITADANDAD